MKSKRGMTRIFAFLLAIMMIISTVDLTSFTSYATEDNEQVITEEMSDEISEEVSEEISDDVTEEVTEENSTGDTEEVTEEDSEEDTEEVTEEDSEEDTEEVTEENDGEDAGDVSEETVEEASEDNELNDETVDAEEAEDVLVGSEDGELYGYVNGDFVFLDCDEMMPETVADYVEKAILYWNETGTEFNSVDIKMPMTDGKAIIGKQIYNAVYRNMKEPETASIRFDFDLDANCTVDWILGDLEGEATQDINAEIHFEKLADKDGLLKVSVAGNQYPVERVYIYYYAESESQSYGEIVEALGNPPDEDYDNMIAMNKACNLLGLDSKLEELGNYLFAWYSTDGYNRASFHISCVEDFEEGGDVYFAKQFDKGTIDTKNAIELKYDSDQVSNVAFKAIDSFSQINNGKLSVEVSDTIARILCTYKNADGKECVEVWAYDTVLGIDSIKFTNNYVEYDWDGAGGAGGRLLWNVRPFDAQIPPQNFEWKVENIKGTPIQLVPKTTMDSFTEEEVAYYDGTYQVTGYGEAIVKVSYRNQEATCTIKVLEPVKIPEITLVYGIYGVDTKLGDLDINEWIKCDSSTDQGTFTWENPEMKLDVPSNDVAFLDACFNVEGRKPVYVQIPVALVQIKDVSIVELKESGSVLPSTLKKGESLNIGLNLDVYPQDHSAYDIVKKYIEGGKLELKWTDKEKTGDFVGETTAYLPRTFTATAKGKKTFKASLMNTKTKKALTTAQATVQVCEKDLFSFSNLNVSIMQDENDEMKGSYILRLSESDYEKSGKKLTVKSEDTSVLQLGKVKNDLTDGIVTITIPYTFKKYGATFIKITANDECKTTNYYEAKKVDDKPVLVQSEIVLDKALTYGIQLSFYYPSAVSKAGEITIKDEKDGSKFIWDAGNRLFDLKDESDCANGTYNVTFRIPYSYKDNPGEKLTVERTLKIKVKHTKNRVKVKQIAPINEFYRYEGGDVLTTLKFEAKDTKFNDATLPDDSIYQLKAGEDGTYNLYLKQGYSIEKLSSAQKKIEILVQYITITPAANFYNESVKLTLKTTKKAPKFYSGDNENFLNTAINDNSTYEYIALFEGIGNFSPEEGLYLYDAKTKQESKINTDNGNDILTHADKYKIGKNEYYITCEGDLVYIQLASPLQAVASKDVITFRARMPKWRESVVLKTTIKVETKAPQYRLSDSTVILNMNEELYLYDYFDLHVTVKDRLLCNIDNLWVGPYDSKSEKVLENNIVIKQTDNHVISAFIKDIGKKEDGTNLKPGTYKFDITMNVNNTYQYFVLKVKVVDVAPSKAFTFKQRGSIDVLDRENTYITLDYYCNNIAYGFPTEFKLAGPDAHLFEAGIVDGDLRIYAKDDKAFSTAKTYQVYPVVCWKNNSGDTVQIKGALQKIKVKQSKRTYVINSINPVVPIFYGEQGIRLGIYGSNKDMTVDYPEKVELINYTDDLYLNYNPAVNYGDLGIEKSNQPSQIKKAKGTYTLKFAVTPKGAAVNEKPIIVSYKVTIIR